MREILFRGKQIDNGEWAEGYYAEENGKTYILTQTFPYDGAMLLEETEVIPETVGQYTGRKKVYEHDIVKFSYCASVYIGRVVFNEKTCGFEIWYNSVVGAYGEKATHKINFANIDKIEVIGNIHDNPELGGDA
jgi:uncharacterized phage protein (TIGR01671 family)